MGDSLLWNDQMKQVYKAMAPIGLAGLGIGGLARAFTGARDGSLAFGDIRQNLKLLANDSDYLRSVTDSITIPRKADRNKTISLNSRLRRELDKEDEFKKESEQKEAAIDFGNLLNPVKTYFRGSSRPTGNESLSDIPAAYPLGLMALYSGISGGRALMDARLKRVSDNKVKKEKEQAKRDFEAALIYEQEEANRRNKKASDQCDLVQAVDALYSAAERYDSYAKTAGVEKGLIGIGGLLAILAGGAGVRGGYSKTKSEIEQKEKEKMLGLNANYDEIIRNLGAKNIGQNVPSVSRFTSPGIGTELVKHSNVKKKTVQVSQK
jgi:hypothetical protein